MAIGFSGISSTGKIVRRLALDLHLVIENVLHALGRSSRATIVLRSPRSTGFLSADTHRTLS